MRAVTVTPGTRRVEVRELPEPRPQSPSDVLLGMIRVGVCGTDREICRFDYGTPPAGDDYLVLGHESLAEVVEADPAVTGWRRGELAVLIVRRPCPDPACDACRAGRQDFCVTGQYVERGIKGAHGFMAERVVEDARWLVRVPETLRDVAVLVEPLTIAEKALLEVDAMLDRMPWRRESVEGLHAVVLGGGPVGLLGAMAFAAAGSRVTLVSRQPEDDVRATLLAAMGGRYVSAEREPLGSIMRGLGRVDLVYEAIGAAPPAFEALQALGPNGLFVFTGVPGRRGAPDVDGAALMRGLVLGNQVVLGTVNAGRGAYEAAVADLGRFIERWPEAVRALVTHHVALADAPRALTSPPEGIKTVIEFAAGS